MKKCTRPNNQNICCCYCEYNQECSVSCFVGEGFNCDDGHCNLSYIEFERKIKPQLEGK